jgi:threonine synthase
VPTGNFGDIFAGEAAERMGLAAKRLVIATNANDIMARALNEGVYEAGAAHHTLSPSMDIQVASNFERALFEASGRDAGWTREAMAAFARDKRLVLPEPILAALRARYDARSSDDEDTLSTINAVATTSNRIIDPHTAVAVNALRKFGYREEPMVVLSTAHAAKFADAVTNATGTPPSMPDALKRVLELPETLEFLPNKLSLIRQFISSRLTP